MTLDNGKIGVKYIVKDISLDFAIKRRLQVLGVIEGTTIELINKKRNGAIIFKVRGTRFAIGKGVAAGIIVGGDNE